MWKILKCPPKTLAIIENTRVKIQKYPCQNTKYPNMQSFFFFFVSSKVNFVFTLYNNNKKTEKPLSSKPLIFWFGGQKNIFTVKKFVKSSESPLPKVVKITSLLVKLYDFIVNIHITFKIGLKTRKLANSIILGQINKLGPSLWVWQQKWKN